MIPLAFTIQPATHTLANVELLGVTRQGKATGKYDSWESVYHFALSFDMSPEDIPLYTSNATYRFYSLPSPQREDSENRYGPLE